MYRKIFVGTILLLVVGVLIFLFRNHLAKSLSPTSSNSETATPPASDSVTPLPPSITWPIAGGKERVTKKSFGTYVTPQNSPVTPEKFIGYHTGWDFETTPEEQSAEISIIATCEGQLVYRNYVSGYGGVAIQSCSFENQQVTMLYGHLRLSSIVARNSLLKIGDKIGFLGNPYSTETDGERKHLHFSVHKGTTIELKGYVQNKADLSTWVDPVELFK